MKRTPIVVAATVAGLVGVLSFHTKAAPLTIGIAPANSATRSSSTTSVAAGSPPSDTTSTGSPHPLRQQFRQRAHRQQVARQPFHQPAAQRVTPPPRRALLRSPTIVPPTTSTTTAPSTTTTTTSPSGTRTATGSSVNYNYGVLSVSVTASGTTITNVQIASLNDGGNFRSQSIDQQSIPILEQEALQAQSANIQGVSGASYTSAGFKQSLQSALGKLGIS